METIRLLKVLNSKNKSWMKSSSLSVTDSGDQKYNSTYKNIGMDGLGTAHPHLMFFINFRWRGQSKRAMLNTDSNVGARLLNDISVAAATNGPISLRLCHSNVAVLEGRWSTKFIRKTQIAVAQSFTLFPPISSSNELVSSFSRMNRHIFGRKRSHFRPIINLYSQPYQWAQPMLHMHAETPAD